MEDYYNVEAVIINGFTKKLEIVGVGYTVLKKEKELIFQLGRSHADIKKIEEKLKFGDNVKIKDTYVGKIKNKKVFNVSLHKNGEELFHTFYFVKLQCLSFMSKTRHTSHDTSNFCTFLSS